MNKKQQWSFRTRVSIRILLLLTCVLAIVFIAFNISMRSYIDRTVSAQLDVSMNSRNQFDNNKPNRDMQAPDMKQGRSKIGAQTKDFKISSDYTAVYDERNGTESSDEAKAIADYLKQKRYDLENINSVHIKLDTGDYSISSMPDGESGYYIIFYVDTTAIYEFSNIVNLVMLAVICAAAVLSFLVAAAIAGSVTKPVKRLSEFAAGIGKGDFSTRDFTFSDREFSEMAHTLNQTAMQLYNYDSEQKTFFQNVSHELRTPLMSIRGYAEGIEYGLTEPVKSSRIIISEADRLTEMVEDLLCISRIDSLTQNTEMSEGDLRETFTLCAESLRSLADKRNVRFIYEFDDKAILFIYNEKYMHRALYNLTANAIRYAKSEITLTCKNENSKILVAVSDNGDGISPELRPHVFERFYKGKDGKHGIGLSIVESVVKLHGGEITVSCDGLTSFRIVFNSK